MEGTKWANGAKHAVLVETNFIGVDTCLPIVIKQWVHPEAVEFFLGNVVGVSLVGECFDARIIKTNLFDAPMITLNEIFIVSVE